LILGPILHRFGDIAGFVLMTHPYFTLTFGVFPLDQIAHVGISPEHKLFEVLQFMWSRYLNVTDRQTDR